MAVAENINAEMAGAQPLKAMLEANESRLESTGRYCGIDELLKTEDSKEGPLAFAEKRKPNWQAK